MYFSVLHPRHKLSYFKNAGWEENWVKAARDIVRAEYDHTYAFMDITGLQRMGQTVSSIFFHLTETLTI